MGWFGHLTLFLYLVYTPYEMCKVEVLYGLDAAQYVVVMHIDTERGMVLRSLRYAIDSEGRETLIESFELLAMRDIS